MSICVTVICDECGSDESEAPPVAYATSRWREGGWRIGKDRQVCPDCRPMNG